MPHEPRHLVAAQLDCVRICDLDTAAFIRETPRVGLDSYNRSLVRNAHGSIDIHFGSAAPAGRDANWIPTVAGRPWFCLFRFYGPARCRRGRRTVRRSCRAVPPSAR
ncbi:DUF1214 domain-containing protein [Plastoroseomonas hellenica]|uniref:DUF1214 domain-containing protein n=1 Tax=Plastoroseomonas hellenica TaxID=2687306 RepID=UPI001BA99F40